MGIIMIYKHHKKADVIIIYQMYEQATCITVVCDDTDVFIVLAHHCSPPDDCNIYHGGY